jgi:hypothetical protein
MFNRLCAVFAHHLRRLFLEIRDVDGEELWEEYTAW